MKKNSALTVLERLESDLRSAAIRFDKSNEAEPVCLLWTDSDGQWFDAVQMLRPRMPELFVLGEYDPQQRQGPAIWLKCVLARTLEIEIPANTCPILYLPRVSRQKLRAGADCPSDLEPLIELQYRGLVWTQRNGKDWTVESYLVSNEGLGLEIAKDEETRTAMRGALLGLLKSHISEIDGVTLRAQDFDRLMESDPARAMLQWMNDPKIGKEVWTPQHWTAFVASARREYAFDVEKKSALEAAELLGMRSSEVWKSLWRRFIEAPERYPNIPLLLEKAKPVSSLIFDKEPWPDENRKAELELGEELLKLRGLDPANARQKVADLEKLHGARRDWVWGKLGHSELAHALHDLRELADTTTSPLGAISIEEFVESYCTQSFRADKFAYRSLLHASSETNRQAAQVAVLALYRPWLVSTVERFQALASDEGYSSFKSVSGNEVSAGEVLLFVDGLRFDCGEELVSQLESAGLKARLSSSLAALPTVTPTAKPAVSPITKDLVGGDAVSDELAPKLRATGALLNFERFQAALLARGYCVDPEKAQPESAGDGDRMWLEYGQIDSKGHVAGDDFPHEVERELERLRERIVSLFSEGWKRVKVVTDHGWLYLPGGLPRQNLPTYLVTAKGARAAVIKGNSKTDCPTVPWTWNTELLVATAPGISVFREGLSYAHGGISPQECIIPVIDVEPANRRTKAAPKITKVAWTGLRCRVGITPRTAGLTVDLRERANDAASSVVAGPKQTDNDGQASLLVKDESWEGKSVQIVAIDAEGAIIHKFLTVIGEEG